MKIAKREITCTNGCNVWLYNIAVHKAFDPKKEEEWLCLYATGDVVVNMKNVFFAKTKDAGC